MEKTEFFSSLFQSISLWIVIGIINNLVALDEVTSALDEVTSINCINYLTEEFERLGTTLLYVSNKSDYKETNLITDNIYVMRNGNVVTYVQK